MKHNWEYKPFKQLANILYGCPFESDYFNSESKGMPLIRIRDVKPGFTSTFFDGDYSDEYIIKKGEYLIGMDGEFNIAPWKSENALLNQRVCRVKSSNEEILSTDFIFYFLGQELKRIEEKTPFVTVKHLSAKVLNSISTPVPHKKIQEQIVAELDKINEVIEDSRELLRNLDALAQSLFYDIFGDPITNPKGFLQKSMGKFASVKIGPFGSLLHKEDYVCGGTPLVNPIHMQNGRVKIDNDFTIDDTKKKVLLNYLLKSGDIVFGRRGDIGRCALITDNEDGYLCGTGSLFVRFNIKINPLFALWCCRQRSVTAYLTEKAKGATMLNINCGIIESAPIILPPLPLQEQFSARIEQIEAEKKHVEATIAELQTLLASRMDYWFN